MNAKSTPVLIVENSDTTLPRLGDALRTAGVENPLITLPDMNAAVAYLNETGEYSDRQKHPLPGLVLLDVTLPRLSAFETVRWLTPPPVSRQIIVANMVGMEDQRPFKSGLAFGPNAVICKLSPTDSLVAMFEELRRHWIEGDMLSAEWFALHAA